MNAPSEAHLLRRPPCAKGSSTEPNLWEFLLWEYLLSRINEASTARLIVDFLESNPGKKSSLAEIFIRAKKVIQGTAQTDLDASPAERKPALVWPKLDGDSIKPGQLDLFGLV
jgi:hypothetical protein